MSAPAVFARCALRAGVWLAGRLAVLAATLAALLLATFALSSLSPIDPAMRLVGDHASAAAYAQARRELGLDEPWPAQFGHYLASLAHGELGVSSSTGQPVREDLLVFFPATWELATVALAVSAILGLGLGFWAARRPGSCTDLGLRALSLGAGSVPVFWLGFVLLFVFYARLHWAGGPGRLDDAFEYTIDRQTGVVLVDAWRSGVPGAFASAVAHLALPAIALVAISFGMILRMTRAAVLAEAGKEYVTLARAKGAGPLRILFRHILPNCAGTLLTMLGLSYAGLLEGAVLTETVFARPGVGRYLTTALFAGDTAAILGATLVIGVGFVLLNGLTDLLAGALDPLRR